MGQNVTAEGCAGLTHGGQGHAAAQERDRNAAPAGVELAIANPRLTAHIYHDGQTHYASVGPLPADGAYAPTLHYVGSLPPIFPEWLGDPGFRNAHHLRFAYVGGEMARGIASAQMVIAFGRAGMLGFLGAAGLGPAVVADAVRTIRADLDPAGLPWGVNLIHSPDEPELEFASRRRFSGRGGLMRFRLGLHEAQLRRRTLLGVRAAAATGWADRARHFSVRQGLSAGSRRAIHGTRAASDAAQPGERRLNYARAGRHGGVGPGGRGHHG